MIVDKTLTIDGVQYKRVVLIHPFLVRRHEGYVILDVDCKIFIQHIWFKSTKDYPKREVYMARTDDDRTLTIVKKKTKYASKVRVYGLDS